MSALVYFGSVPHANQLVSEENRSRGIAFCRASLQSLQISGLRRYTHPSYELYLSYLPLSLRAAVEGKHLPITREMPYYVYPKKDSSSFCRDPTIIWTYGDKKPTEFLDILKNRYNASETTAGGRPALSAILRPDQVRTLVVDTTPIQTTPFSVNNLNLQGFKTYRFLHSLAHALSRLQQYALVPAGSVDFAGHMVEMFEWEKSNVNTSNTTGDFISWSPKIDKSQIHMNLPAAFDTFDYCIRNANDIPNDSGLLFPFVENLARDDESVIPHHLSGWLRGFLGPDPAAAIEVMKVLLEGWKNVGVTHWGKELSHWLVGLRLAFECGAGFRVLLGPQGNYTGFLLHGAHFTVTVGGNIFVPQTFESLQDEYKKASPHLASLSKLYDLINFASDMDRVKARDLATSLSAVAGDIRAYGYNVNHKDQMARLARDITFVNDRYLPLNSSNLAAVLNSMSGNGRSEEAFPLHHLALFSNDKNHRLLSAFGASAPSFIIEGGRKIELSGSFSFTRRGAKGGMSTEVSVNTMYVAIKPFQDACNDLDRVIAEKMVLTIAGTPMAARVSARATIREYSANMGTEVLAALRRVAKVTVLNNPSASNEKKRKAEEDTAEESSKRARAVLDF